MQIGNKMGVHAVGAICILQITRCTSNCFVLDPRYRHMGSLLLGLQLLLAMNALYLHGRNVTEFETLLNSYIIKQQFQKAMCLLQSCS